jgi:vacuolar protein sorting-associated protein 13D
LEQLRPGTGHLSVRLFTEGPTRLIQITNIQNKSYLSINWYKNETQNSNISNEPISSDALSTNSQTLSSSFEPNSSQNVLEVYINLTGGIGVSLVQWLNQEYEELVYAYFKCIELILDQNKANQRILFNVGSVQICNQLFNSCRHNLLSIPTAPNNISDPYDINNSDSSINALISKQQPAIELDLFRQFKYENIITIKHLIIKLADVNLQLEEKLLWKLIQFGGYHASSELSYNVANESNGVKKKSYENTRLNDSCDRDIFVQIDESNQLIDILNSGNYYKKQIDSFLMSSKEKKFSFNKLQINQIVLNLSVYKSSKLSSDLMEIKSSLGIPLVQFENAKIELKPFLLMNEHDRLNFIINSTMKHYKQELRSHAIQILGSVDFLGNPLGCDLFYLIISFLLLLLLIKIGLN